MNVVLRLAYGDVDVEILGGHGGRTAGDLRDLVDPAARRRGAMLAIDGLPIDHRTGWSEMGLRRGSVVEVVEVGAEPACEESAIAAETFSLGVTGGPCAGPAWSVHGPAITVGRGCGARGSIDNATVSPSHLRLNVADGAVVVEDLGSHNGTRIEGEPVRGPAVLPEGAVLSFGSAEASLRRHDAGDLHTGVSCGRPNLDGTVAFNRPPTPPLPALPASVGVPDAAPPKGGGTAFSIAALVVPLVVGLMMVKVMGNVRYALFTLVGPVMLVSNHIAARRRRAKDFKSGRRRFRRELIDFRQRLSAAATEARLVFEATCPDPAEIGRRALLPSVHLWERRWHDPAFLKLRVGRGSRRWEPPVDGTRVQAAPELIEAVDVASCIARCPIEVDLSAGGVVGLMGDRSAALALARALVLQASVLHGPADVGLVVLASQRHAPAWDWSKWLPHARSPETGGVRLSGLTGSSNAMMQALLDANTHGTAASRMVGSGDTPHGNGPVTLIVVDDEELTSGRHAPTRGVLQGRAGPIAGIVIAASADRLPSVCTAVVHLADDLGDAAVFWPGDGERIEGAVIAGVGERFARSVARRLARLEDPELRAVGVALPRLVELLPLVGLERLDAAGLARRWVARGAAPPVVPIGVGEGGEVALDLVSDGPHALIGGTTGSGKSEFLRSFVAGLAAHASPEHLVFFLVDYKGGSAFDRCADLPHTVGVVTDLDGHLAERALKSLDAELRHREWLLRSAGAADLREYLDLGAPCGALPRLVVVVDEFATLASELPDFMGALVGVAQRGRSLGVHMVLATQRPAGVVDANIKANTDIRVALRMQDAGDSNDVIDRPDACFISRHSPGRAFVRLGPADVVEVQTPLSTATRPPEGSARLGLRPFTMAAPEDLQPPPAPAADVGTDLERVVSLCRDAFGLVGSPAQRRPWLDMIDEHLPLAAVLADAERADGIPVALGDDPDRQRYQVITWHPHEGHLGLFGLPGSGTSSALRAAVLAAVGLATPAELHVYVLDYGGGALGALLPLPHVGAIVGAAETERQVRLVDHLVSDLDRRRGLSADARSNEPQILLVIDGFGVFLACFEGLEGQRTTDGIRRLMAEGAAFGIALLVSADRAPTVPVRMLASVTARFLFRHADPGDFISLGFRQRDLPAFVPGRAVHAETGLVAQFGFVADVEGAVAEVASGVVAVGGGPWAGTTPAPIESMPVEVPMAAVVDLVPAGELLGLPVGIADPDRHVEVVSLHRGEHLLVAGQARSGVSTTLRMLAHVARRSRPDLVMVAVGDRQSPIVADGELLDASGTAAELEKVFELAMLDVDREWLVLVDDAHRLESPGAMGPLLEVPHCHFIVGARSERLHGQFNHWTRSVRRSGLGLLLRPRLDVDGDLLGVRLPRRLSVPMVPGRGFLVEGGEFTLIQVAGADLAA